MDSQAGASSRNFRTDESQMRAMSAVLARNWWVLAIRGGLGIAVGLLALVLPAATMLALVLLFAAYMLVDGVFAIMAAVRAAREHERWGLLVLEGVRRGDLALAQFAKQLDLLVDALRLLQQAATVKPIPVPLAPMLIRLRRDHDELASRKGLTLRTRPTDIAVMSDPVMFEVTCEIFFVTRSNIRVRAGKCLLDAAGTDHGRVSRFTIPVSVT
jgi:hypothetical protein